MTRCFEAQVLTPQYMYKPTLLWRSNSWLATQPKLQQSRTSVHAMNQCICQTGLADDWLDSIHFSSVAQSCPALCNPMDCSTPGLPVYHQLLELTQTHVHLVSDTIQPSHPLSFPSPPALNLSQHQGLFEWVSSSHQVAKVLEFQFQHQSFHWISRTDFL